MASSRMTGSSDEGSDGAMHSNNQVKSVDVMSPYYIHASDNPGQIYVSELLNDGNYGEWMNDMSNVLFAKNKFGFVDGTIPKPPADSHDVGLWMRCDAMIKGWLKSSMDKEVRSSVRYAKSAQEIWEDLGERFGKVNAPRAYELRRAVALLKQEKLSVSAYYTKLKGLWDEMYSISPWPRCTCGGCTCDIQKQLREVKDRDQMYDFLMGLDEAFGTIKTQVLSMRPTPSLGTVYHLIAEDEQQKQISTVNNPKIEAAAFQVQGARGSKDKDGQRSERKDRPKCEHCNKLGHVEEECFEIIGYPPGWNKGKREKKGGPWINKKDGPKVAQVGANGSPISGLTQAQYDRLLQFLGRDGEAPKPEGQAPPTVNMAGKINFTKPWIIDSGATEHITCNGELLDEIRQEVEQQPVKIPNGESVTVKGVGRLCLPNGMRVDNVLNIPSFKCNLLSVSKLTKEFNCALTFVSDMCVMQDLPTRNLIGVGRQCDGLYLLEPMHGGVALSATGSKEVEIWHQRLGHASEAKVKTIQFLSSKVESSKIEHCDSCIRAKQTRLPFPKSEIKSTACFDLIHCDIWGGYRVASLSGGHYLLTIVDDFSRGVWVYIMKHKSDVSHYLPMFLNMVETQFGKKVKQIRADNGGEFQSRHMQAYYEEHGIVIQTTCVHTPQQNGVVERKHRHILEIARALRFHANLPIKFWGECVLTAVYIINRLPSKVIGNKTPYEILLQRRPSYSHLKILGCLAYVHEKSREDKFSERGKPHVFIGYPNGQKGYRLYDIESGKVCVSRDVIFFEDKYPYGKGECKPSTERAVTQRTDPYWDEDHVVFSRNNERHFDMYNEQRHGEEEAMEEPVVVPEQESSISRIETRRTQRVRQLPKQFEGFEVNLPPSIAQVQPTPPAGNSVVYPLSQYISYKNFSHSHKALLSAITSLDEPKTFS